MSRSGVSAPPPVSSSRSGLSTLPFPLVAQNLYGAGNTVAKSGVSAAGTSRSHHRILQDCTAIVLVYGGWACLNPGSSFGVDTDFPAPLQLMASLSVTSYGIVTPVNLRATFGGRVLATLEPGGILRSDPVPIDLARGMTLDVLTDARLAADPTQASFYATGISWGASGGFLQGGTGTVSITAGSTSATAASAPATGPAWAAGQEIVGTGIPPNTIISAVSGSGPYTLTLSQAAYLTNASVSVITAFTAPGCTAVPNSSAYLVAPMAILGSVQKPGPAVGIVGDSIAAGVGDMNGSYGAYDLSGNDAGGFIARALTAAGIPWLSIAKSGETAQHHIGPGYQFRRDAMLSGLSHFVCELGVNDLGAGRPALTVATDLLALWRRFWTMGTKGIQTTITPLQTSSTDSWQTTGNQTANAQNAQRVTLNAWIRAGAPFVAAQLALTAASTAATLLSGSLPVGTVLTGPGLQIECTVTAVNGAAITLSSQANQTIAAATVWGAVAAGTPGAVTMGAPGHPLVGYWEVADAAEIARDAGKFPAPGITATINTTSGSSAITITGGSLSPGYAIAAAGIPAGTSILTVSGNTATLSAAATATATGVTAGTAYTGDGLHPQGALHALMAAACTTALLHV